MRQCPSCKENIPEEYNFCMKCGFNVKKFDEENSVRFCPGCGAKSAGGRFCHECGFDLASVKGAGGGVGGGAKIERGNTFDPSEIRRTVGKSGGIGDISALYADKKSPSIDIQKPRAAASLKAELPEKLKGAETVTLGQYPQDKGGGKRPIEWLILSAGEHDALLISRFALDCCKYHENRENVTWETSSIRKWLNEVFFNEAFSTEEKGVIAKTTVDNPDNEMFPSKSKGGKPTADKVYLLSEAEAKSFFKDRRKRVVELTEYAKVCYAEVGGDPSKPWWWLRSPGGNQTFAAKVENTGNVSSIGYFVNDADCVRPVIRLEF